ncbi:proteoglycan 4 isoform X2 [Neodiprion pinetum]|uniref:proteoglycan 4 isoform X2 n=1 Tax=Neodiprion pinetum TaxID=441929 RepID=UPI001EDF3AD1|nr:CRACD-like protein isoform X2 [Neodiprion pinetum]XP_046603103.1 CRACD-like protein isoform X2 [Neodiprion virginianus]
MRIILLVIPVCLLVLSEARRVPQSRQRVEERQVYYVDEDEEGAGVEEEESPVVYQPRTRALPSPRSKDTSASKPPPVQTIRNYNKVNDDGSFTFGYEAADGSFKEETRGTDCVVRGKYGYVDPDGNKREFTYVSGNPCDPNAPKDEDEEPVRGQPEDDVSGPANYPSVRPVQRPTRPTYAPTTRAPTTIFQTQYQISDDDESQELEDVRPQPPQRRPPVVSIPRRQHFTQPPATPAPRPAVYQPTTPRYQAPTTPASTIYRALEATTTPAPQPQTYRPQFVPAVAITPRPHAAQVAAQYAPVAQTERPGVIYAPGPGPQTVRHRSTSPAPIGGDDFAAEIERYVNTVGLSPRPVRPTQPVPLQSQKPKQAQRADPIYQSELVFDPATARQQLAQRQQTEQEPRASAASVYRQREQLPQTAAAAPQPQAAIFRQQQAQIFQQSQQLYAQQQRRQQQPHRFQLLESQEGSQPFYYISPSPSAGSDSSSLSAGQIDQFLRGASAGF